MKKAAAILVGLMMLCAPARAEPRRIVSLDYCADQFVLALADRDQIAAVSKGATRYDSFYRARAAGLRQTRGTLEEVLALRPDLVVRTWGGGMDAPRNYARFGVPLLQLGDTPDFDGARRDLVRANQAIGRTARGARLIADFDARLARLRRAQSQERPDVLYLTVGGAVAGRGVMMDSVIHEAGGRNVRTEMGWNVLPMERLMIAPPPFVALGFFNTGQDRMSPWARSRHPALRRVLSRATRVALPADEISCEAWYTLGAAERLAQAIHGS